MGKKENLVIQLKTIMADRAKLERFIIDNSDLPGPRANLELAYALAEVYENLDVLIAWSGISESLADVNDPLSFLPFCSAVCLGKAYVKTKNARIISILKKQSADGRWRIREAASFGFQLIGMDDFEVLRKIFSEWIRNSGNLEKRAILVSLAHPDFLNEERAVYCLEVADIVLSHLDLDKDFDVLRKGLDFTISVYAASNPAAGFNFIKKWIGKNEMIDRIMKENLSKKRLANLDPEEAKNLINLIKR